MVDDTIDHRWGRMMLIGDRGGCGRSKTENKDVHDQRTNLSVDEERDRAGVYDMVNVKR